MDLERPAFLSGSTRSPAFVVPVYVAAVFVSALLLFAVQPMFTRMVLPQLGGSPAVWSVAMVFFQTMLLAGYAYAHLLTRATRPLVSVGLHLALLAAAAMTLPLSIAHGWGAPPSAGEAVWLLGLFAASIGLPFFALSANNPLLQAWFVETGHPGAGNPYFLYAASNIGSFLALLAYPMILEPTLPLRAHLSLWTVGFYLLIVLIAACGVTLVRAPRASLAQREAAEAATPPRWTDFARWIVLAAVPSGLLVAVTAHISTDVAAAPLLWVIPLSLYLITWVIVFQTNPLLSHRAVTRLTPFAIVGLVILMASNIDEILSLTLGVHLAAFFIVAMACHGELSRLRPHPRYLTAFYLSLSAGGMIGGIFAGLVAPHVFSWIAEYPILVVLAVLCLPRSAAPGTRYAWLFWVMTGAALLVLLPGLFGWVPSERTSRFIAGGIMALAATALLVRREPAKFALGIALALALVRLYPIEAGRIETVRSFFGVHKLRETADGFRVLSHGTTIHGAQRIRDENGQPILGRPKPLTYYHDEAPMTQALAVLREAKGPLKVAVIGLGAGSLACQMRPGEEWRYFEIDPDVIRIARDPKRFTFLQSCAPDVPIVVGDARLTLAKEPDGHYDAIVVDAFSSDSIPVHLVTQEAMAIYKAKLAPGGAVIMHVSNRHLELASVVAGIAAANGLKTFVHYDEDNEDREDEYIFSSTVAVAVADPAHIGDLAASEDWEEEAPEPGQRVWTDDYSNIVGAILRQRF
jgi:hypothetical protein